MLRRGEGGGAKRFEPHPYIYKFPAQNINRIKIVQSLLNSPPDKNCKFQFLFLVHIDKYVLHDLFVLRGKKLQGLKPLPPTILNPELRSLNVN